MMSTSDAPLSRCCTYSDSMTSAPTTPRLTKMSPMARCSSMSGLLVLLEVHASRDRIDAHGGIVVFRSPLRARRRLRRGRGLGRPAGRGRSGHCATFDPTNNGRQVDGLAGLVLALRG